MTDADIAAVVVTYRSAETIGECLERLRAADGVAEIRVVDNASDDGTMEIVQRHAVADARVRFVANPDNPGFGTACNQGAAASGAPWLVFVNPDCLVEPDSLARLRAHARACARDALIGADLVDEAGVRDGAARRRDPDFAAMLRSASARRLDVPVDEAATLQAVPAISGALMLLPRAAFARVGGFDAAYRLHAEDLDLCRRLREAGAFVAVANDVRVVHVRGVSSRSRPLFVEWHKHRGLWRYFRKFDARRHGLSTRAAVWAMISARCSFALVKKIGRAIARGDSRNARCWPLRQLRPRHRRRGPEILSGLRPTHAGASHRLAFPRARTRAQRAAHDRGILYTLKHLMVRPGHLIRDYIDGQRAHHVKPLFLIMISAAFVVFLTKYLLGGDVMGAAFVHGVADGARGGGSDTFDPTPILEAFEAANAWMNHHFALVTLMLLPLEAAMFKLAFWRWRNLNYPEWLVITSFLTAQTLILWGLSIPLQRWFPGAVSWTLCLTIAYGVFSMTQFFSESPRWKTALRTLLGFGLYMFVSSVLTVVVVVAMFLVSRHA
ncbi:MAG: glycosyltransferase [Aquabacterium sp.]